MQKQFSDLGKKLEPTKDFLLKHKVVVFILVVASVYNFMLFRINQLASLEPSPQQLEDKLQNVKKVTIDDETVEKLELLDSQEINIEALFDNGRNNPFQE